MTSEEPKLPKQLITFTSQGLTINETRLQNVFHKYILETDEQAGRAKKSISYDQLYTFVCGNEFNENYNAFINDINEAMKAFVSFFFISFFFCLILFFKLHIFFFNLANTQITHTFFLANDKKCTFK